MKFKIVIITVITTQSGLATIVLMLQPKNEENHILLFLHQCKNLISKWKTPNAPIKCQFEWNIMEWSEMKGTRGKMTNE